MIIRNADVYTENGSFEVRDVYVAGDTIVEKADRLHCQNDGAAFADAVDKGIKAELWAEDIIDAAGCYLIPGLTDIHFHGCVGRDFCEGTQEAIEAMAAYEASVGVTTILPATMTIAQDRLYQICRAAAEYHTAQIKGEKKGKAVFCGIHMEGPFLSKEKTGAQNPEFIRAADNVLFEKMQELSGELIRLTAIAPETKGAMDFIRRHKDELVLSVAHTTADYDTAMEAFAAGAKHVTHLYNAMPGFSHRAPAIVGAAADAGAEVELICDGVHVHPSVVRATLKMMGEDRVIFVSDSMMATGLCDGDYALGGQPVKVKGNLATLKDGTIAGSVTNLMDCLRKAVSEMQIPLETAVKCAAVNPAKSIGIYDEYGSITPGKKANLVLLDKESLEVRAVILLGDILWQSI